jgi:hypothetical protein
MQFEDFNKKVKEAAEQHHPAYDEQAWQKMEKLLDQHMPQEKEDRRRFIPFLLLFLLVGGGLFVIIGKPWQSANNLSEVEHATTQPEKSNSTSEQTTGSNEHTPDQSATVHSNSQEDLSTKIEQSLSTQSTGTQSSNLQAKNHRQIHQGELKSNQPLAVQKPGVSAPTETKVSDAQNNVVKNNNEVTSVPQTDPLTTLLVQKPANKSEEVKPVTEASKQEPTKNTAATEKKKQGNNFLSGFGLSVSAGPDVSKAGNSSLGRVTVAYGAAIGYTWKRFTLKTGVFSAKKLYSANEGDYKLNYNLPSSVKFEGADADCRVTEIPVLLSYNFADKKKSSWSVTAGVSTYLMKRESYTYWYSTSGGAYYPKYFEFRDKNKHYFSVLDLSAGYTRKINDHFTVTAEPYVKIPYQGIGQGQVQLNSAGILFSVGVKPFATKQKK